MIRLHVLKLSSRDADGANVYLAIPLSIWLRGYKKRLDQVQVGEFVDTLNPETYKVEQKPITGFVSNGVRQTLTVYAGGRKITSTPNHPHLVNNKWVEAKDIKIGDLIAVAINGSFGSQRMNPYELDLLAIWLAEGAGSTISSGSVALTDICKEAARLGFDQEFTQKSKYDWHIVGTGKGCGFKETNWTKFLKKHGLYGLTSKTKVIPECVFQLPKDQLARFLNLIFATDGCISRDGRLEIGLANQKMVEQIAELLKRFGIHGTITHKIHKARSLKSGEQFESWTWRTKKPEAITSFAFNIGALGKEEALENALRMSLASRGNCNEYLPITYDELVPHLVYEIEERGIYGGYNAKHERGMSDELRENLKSWRKQSTHRLSTKRYDQIESYTDKFFSPIRLADVIWQEVTAIEDSGEQETFDLSIADNANFVANGFYTHNTQFARIELVLAALTKPRSLVWYVAPTYSMANDIMWASLLATIPKSYLAKKPNDTKMTIWLKNGSIIQLKGADKPDSLRGRGVDLCVLDEYQDFKTGTWEEVIRPTLADRRGKAIVIGTPKAYNHLYELYQKGQDPHEPDYASWQFPTSTSPFIPKQELIDAKRSMDERSYKQEFEASFTNMAGRVYYPFDRAIHVGDYPFDPNNYIIVGQDFNVDPMSSVIMQLKKPSLELWVIDEIMLRQSSTIDVLEELERRYHRLFPNRVAFFPDPAGGNRSSSRGESDIHIIAQKGIKHIHYHKKHPFVSDRINAVNSMLRSFDGTVRLRIDRKCKHTIESLEQVIYKPNSREVDKTQNNEHITDALGYPVEYLFPVNKLQLIGVSR